ncbi:hypothetical protein BDR07DRAFT_1279395 [Suillus spraguei]|nr:hypothetical protein BDR07DRAFT_1279395 [Suillus spraguei]
MNDSFFTLDDLEPLYSDLRDLQEGAAVTLRDIFRDGQLKTIWLLLDASEQKRYLLAGLERASESSTLWGQDCRALCPEVTVSNFLLEGGKGYIAFLTRFLEVFESSDPAFLPNSWWKQTSNAARSESTKVMFEVATINRNKFICFFVSSSLMSIIYDIIHRSNGMKDVLNIVENTEAFFAHSLALANTTLRNKPLLRCENCTKTLEEIGQGARFKVCGGCKTKLKFSVHYCSRSCQKEDWPVHKKACGKKKVSKGLKGTKGDDLWKYTSDQMNPIVDTIRDLPKNQDGTVSLTGVGVGPCQGKRSPAAERQAKMLEADKDVDYFLFNSNDVPVRFVIDDPGAKMVFRINRRMLMMQTSDSGLGALAECLLKHMSGYPGLSRDMILKQLCAEHGNDTIEKIAKWERRSQERGISADTMIESLSEDFMKMVEHTFS